MISNSGKMALTKKLLFPLAENSFALAGSRILKNTFSLYGSTASTLKNIWNYPKKLVSSIWFVFKIWFPPNFSNIFHKHKKTWNKKIMFPIDKKTPFSPARMKDWLKIMFQLKKKLVPLGADDCCLRKWKKMFSMRHKISFH